MEIKSRLSFPIYGFQNYLILQSSKVQMLVKPSPIDLVPRPWTGCCGPASPTWFMPRVLVILRSAGHMTLSEISFLPLSFSLMGSVPSPVYLTGIEVFPLVCPSLRQRSCILAKSFERKTSEIDVQFLEPYTWLQSLILWKCKINHK